jgi:hypothetical protein
MSFPQIFLIISLGIAPILPPRTLAQTPNLDELPGDVQQLRTWLCQKDKSLIAVEAKDVQNWKSLIDKEAWTCDEQTTNIPIGVNRLSCEPQDNIAIVRIFWLKGTGGEGQLGLWGDSLATEGMICTTGQVTPLGNEENAF